MSRAELSPARQRGQPLMALLAVIAMWIAVRMLLWQSPLAAPLLPFAGASATQEGAAPSVQDAAGRLGSGGNGRAPGWLRSPVEPWLHQPADRSPADSARLGDAGAELALADPRPVPARRIVGHTMLLAAGLAHLPLAPGLENFLQGGGPARLAPPADRAVMTPFAAGEFAQERRTDRWSLDGWVLLRGDTSAPSAAIQPSYGRSQAGGVLRYALAPDNPRLPQAYLRTTTALEGAPEHEAALGLSARPVAQVPVRVAAEARLANTAQGTGTRAALLAISELPPVSLPAGLTAEAYLQAGYVAGDFATGFVDGLARATREVATLRDFRLSAGGGTWGGAQEGAQRLDVGPSALVSFPLGDGFGRLAAEYRFRVAGEAEPASGPALTLSAGF